MSFNKPVPNDFVKYHLDNDDPRLVYNGRVKNFLDRKLFWKANFYIYLENDENTIEHTHLTWYSQDNDGRVEFRAISGLIQPIIDEHITATGKAYYIDSYVVLRPSLVPFKKEKK